MVRAITAVAAPVVIATAAVIGFVVAEGAGLEPLSLGSPRNIAEAAGLGDAADMIRLLNTGQDPARVYPIRREIISGAVRYASALEAAIWSRRVQLVQLLNERYPIPPSERQRMLCLARELQTSDIESYLADGATVSCGATITDEVTARSAEGEP